MKPFDFSGIILKFTSSPFVIVILMVAVATIAQSSSCFSGQAVTELLT